MSTNLLVLAGDHVLRCARVAVPPVVRLTADLNPPGSSEGWAVVDLSAPGGSREIVRETLARIAWFGPVHSRYDRAVLVLSLSVGDLRNGGVSPLAWRRGMTAVVRGARALGYEVSILSVAFADDEQGRDARRWLRRIAKEIEGLVRDELVEHEVVDGVAWPDPFDPGDDGAGAIVDAVRALATGSERSLPSIRHGTIPVTVVRSARRSSDGA